MKDAAAFGHWQHSHVFDRCSPLAERNTRWVVWLTAATMVAEIAGGWLFNSMALLADGWHMSSHALALGLSVLAFAAARRFAQDPRFAFGTWKIEVLGGYTSALFLVGVAALMVFQSVGRLLAPTPIHYDQAIGIALLGLLVNLVCAWLLKDGHGHDHADHGHHDLNLRAAYLHVLADAATSLLAIVALSGGKLWGAAWLDPVMGIVGASLVGLWALGLLRETSRVLTDAEMDRPVVGEVRAVVAGLPVAATIADLHVWRVGRDRYACILSLVVSEPLEPAAVHQALGIHEELAHVTVEIHRQAATADLASPPGRSPGPDHPTGGFRPLGASPAAGLVPCSN